MRRHNVGFRSLRTLVTSVKKLLEGSTILSLTLSHTYTVIVSEVDIQHG